MELPTIFCLLEQIAESPPYDFMASAQAKLAKREAEREKMGALGRFKTSKGKVKRRTDYGD